MKIKNCVICDGVGFEKLFIKLNYQLVKCRSCNFIFINPIPNRNKLESYYKNFNYKSGYFNETIIRQDSKRTIIKLKRLGFKDGLLFDVGCGAGFFLDEARKAGYKVQGIDVSKDAIIYAKNILKLNVTNADLLDCKYPNNKFRIITLIQVIEHLIDPKPILRKIYKLLEHNGVLYIATPNINSYLSKTLQKDFNYMIPPEHIGFYSNETLSKILSKVGFKIIKINTWGYPTDLVSIIKFLLKRETNIQLKRSENNTEEQLKEMFNKKKLKYLLFDKLFCKIFYKLLNQNYGGSILEIYAQK